MMEVLPVQYKPIRRMDASDLWKGPPNNAYQDADDEWLKGSQDYRAKEDQ